MLVTLIASCVLSIASIARPSPVASEPLPTGTLDQELTDLASTLPNGSGRAVSARPGARRTWDWDAATRQWRIKDFRGVAIGQLKNPPTNEIWIWVDIHGYDVSKGSLMEQVEVVASCVRTLAHEVLHFPCPPHSGPPPGAGIPAGEPDPKRPPTGEGRSPDCNDINYAIHSAAALCAQLNSVASGQAVQTPTGTPIAGTDTAEGRCAYCRALKAEYEGVQKRWNTDATAKTAVECACGQPPWTPQGTPPSGQYVNCPGFPPPSGGCGGVPPYPNNKVIPDCSVSCPCE